MEMFENRTNQQDIDSVYKISTKVRVSTGFYSEELRVFVGDQDSSLDSR